MAYNRVYLDIIENKPFFDLSLGLGLWLDHVVGAIADTLRIVAAILLFITAFLSWGHKKKSFSQVKKYLATAILFEGIYWLAVVPENLRRIILGRDPLLLYIGFGIEILAAGIVLVLLGVKVWKYKVGESNNLLKWGCIAGIGYIFAMWAYNIFRWLSMSGYFGPIDPRIAVDLFGGFTSLGFLNTAITLTTSLAFAIAGSTILIKNSNRKRATQLIGVAIFLFGLHFALYTLYAWFSPNEWAFVLVLTQIWPIPLIGLGAGLLKGKI